MPEFAAVTPAAMRQALRDGANKASFQQAPWDPRLGYGILNVPGTLAALRAPKPPPPAS